MNTICHTPKYTPNTPSLPTSFPPQMFHLLSFSIQRFLFVSVFFLPFVFISIFQPFCFSALFLSSHSSSLLLSICTPSFSFCPSSPHHHIPSFFFPLCLSTFSSLLVFNSFFFFLYKSHPDFSLALFVTVQFYLIQSIIIPLTTIQAVSACALAASWCTSSTCCFPLAQTGVVYLDFQSTATVFQLNL